MAFTFTVIPDYVFDQVLTFTNANTLKDNQEDIHDSLSIEHTFSSGIHARITKASNLIINPTARRGNAFWWDGGAATDYDTPTTDDDKALVYGAPNFLYDHWTPAGGAGPSWKFAGASSGFLADLSEAIPIGAAFNLTLSGEISVQVYVAGNAYIDVVAYDVTNKYLGVICQTSVSATSSDFVTYELTGVTPANTTYIRIRKWMDATWDSTLLQIRKLKVERGFLATTYSDECSMPQYLSARYTSQAGFTIADDALTTINFERGPAGVALALYTWDDPGANRVTVGANWEFEADRFMKLAVSTGIRFDIAVPWQINDFAILYLMIDTGGGFNAFAVLDREDFPVAKTTPLQMNGGTTIYLQKGWKLRIAIHQKSGAVRDLKNDSLNNYVDIREF